MRFMLDKMPRPRHTLFFSATLSREIEALIHEFLTNPVRISVKTRDTSKNIDQDVIRIAAKSKFDVLLDLLRDPEFEKVLVFSRTKHGTEKLAKALAHEGIPSESIHGNKQQSARQRSLANFKEGRARVLVATDVAARGLDIPNVSHVINYDVPATYEDYVHRIGRTGRAEKKGKALTFIE
jgi:superfamily II DNA/RNA helicase